jgi:hypothetical protein
MISSAYSILRNSLISLALGIVATTAWAAPPPTDNAAAKTTTTANGGPVNAVASLNIPMQIPANPPKPRLLDLKPPDIRTVMSTAQIAAAIPNPEEMEVEGETVQVRSATPGPFVPGGFAALYWAATHPSQAWRILAPAQ